jgi:hypothetical protein
MSRTTRRLLLTAALVAVLAATVVFQVLPSEAASAPAAGSRYTLQSGASGKCVDVVGASTAGAGATTNSNRPQLSDSAAANYTPQKYLAGSNGWSPR